MAAEKADALVLRTTDWSETSKIATLWTREFGKVRALAKGGRRLKSNFETALDLLTHCSIVFLRKSSGSLDLLTEARVVERFGQLRTNLSALYAGYYIAELLSEWTEDFDPHPLLFDEALAALRDFGKADVPTGPRLVRFEMTLLRELGYSPAVEHCAACNGTLSAGEPAFSAAAGGAICPTCQPRFRDRRPLSPEAWQVLRSLGGTGEAWQGETATPWSQKTREELRQLLNQYVSYSMGRRPRLLPYLGS